MMTAESRSFAARKMPFVIPGMILVLHAMIMQFLSFTALNITDPGIGLHSMKIHLCLIYVVA
jgi:hypothetical protein